MAPGCSSTSLSVSKVLGVCVLGALLYRSVCAGLYSDSDQIGILNLDNVDSVLFDSTSATLVEFYASWCGHCISFSPRYKDLARDVKEWRPVVTLAAIDCADDLNRRVCTRFSIRGYPSLKFFPAFSSSDFKGQSLEGFPRDVPGLRHLIIDKLESHKEAWPPACPPLKPISLAELSTSGLNATGHHLALVFEDADSYVGREVILDLVQFVNISVRRVLRSEEGLVFHLGVTDFPSCYLYYSHTNFSRLSVVSEARTFYSYALQRLPGVARTGNSGPGFISLITNQTEEPWRPFNKTRVYMSDLESALHYSLREELASHPKISGNALKALRSFVSVLAKYFPGRPPVKAALKAVHDWLQEQKGNSVSYGDFKLALDPKSANSFLPVGVRWVACQGSKPHYRGYPCSMWMLFHTLSVQAEESKSEDPQEVLQAMREYVRHFFGCRECATHFENMAQEGMDEVLTLNKSILWLWSRHNLVNNRLAGALSEDPHFPKLQWPPPELCPSCHGLTSSGEHAWGDQVVLKFLKSHYSAQRILHDYVSNDFSKPLKDRRRAREAVKKGNKEDMHQVKGNQYGGPNLRKPRMKRRDSEDGVHSSGRRMKRDLAFLEAERGVRLVKEAEPGIYIHSLTWGWMFLLSTIAILAMYLYISLKLRLRRAKVALL